MEKFQPTFESLNKYECPEWFRDAKLGIWAHWGPQSVPMFGDWYARNMYLEGNRQYLHHLHTYGHPSKHGYFEICQQWKAEKFDPDALMKLYVEAGAKYFVSIAMHHDNFFLFPSKYNKYNSFEMGPHKDIVGMWKQSAKKYNLPFGLTEHHGASFSWNYCNKKCDENGPFKGVPYDGSNPELADFYYKNQEHVIDYKDTNNDWAISKWYTENKEFHKHWLNVMKELIDTYEPDLFYSDGGLPFGQRPLNSAPNDPPTSYKDDLYKSGLEMLSHLYNKSIEKYGENRAVYNQKDPREEICNVGVLDVERTQLEKAAQKPWQTDTCIGSWFYNVAATYKTPAHVIDMLVDIVSKNGCLLLNIPMRPDGTIDDYEKYFLKELGKWTKINGEGIYGTRPWREWKEGDTTTLVDGMKEQKAEWTASDYRFTCKGNKVYAFELKAPENGVSVIKTFKEDEKVKNVKLLGYGDVEFSQFAGTLTIKLPQQLPTEYIICFEIEIGE